MEAAFFDLDKTVISKSAMMAFGWELHRAGLLDGRDLARGLWTHVLFVKFGASPRRMARIQRSALSVTRGWSQAEVRRVVELATATVIPPVTFAEAVELMAEHRAAGRRLYLVSASPAEIVEPLAEHLQVDEVLASQAAIDEAGCYTGALERYCYGPHKATLVRQVARTEGLDLEASWAYTDSITDVPLLEAVGHPVAVNPDRALRRIAHARGWEICRFRRLSAPRPKTRRCIRPWSLAGLAAVALGVGGARWARRRAPRDQGARIVSP